MLTRGWLSVALLVVVPVWSQVSSPISPAPTVGGDDQMATPPPVSGQAYPTEVGAEAQSNYLRGGLTFRSGYIDNFYAGSGGSPLSETTFSVLSTISFDQTTPRQHRMLSYSPGFTFYRPSSGLDETDQSAVLLYMFRPTPHMSVNLNDSLEKSSTAFAAPGSGADGAVSGSSPDMVPGVIAPFADRLTNNAAMQFSLQYSPMAMIGGSGTSMELHYPNPSEVSDLYDSDMRGGSTFFNRRIAAEQYTGINYQYSQMLTYPPDAQSETVTHTIDGFYSIDSKGGFSISISGGAQRYEVTQTSLPGTGAWGPNVTASAGWQTLRTNFAASYAHEVTGGGGLLGAFHSNSANAFARWQASRTWTLGASGSYAINKSVTPLLLFAMPGGHSIAARATVGRSLSRQLNLGCEYDRVHQSYTGITAISDNPNSDREIISLAWQFTRPLGK